MTTTPFGIFLATLVLIAAASTGVSQSLPLSTSSDSSLYYYEEGWRQVLDVGHFSRSEKAYRRMYALDPGFLVGASLLARITPDPKERQSLLDMITSRQAEVKADESLLLQLFIDLTQLYIYRENGQTSELANHRKKTMLSGEQTLELLAQKYPDDWYYGCEYVEFVHANKGPEAALERLQALFPKPPPFMVGYAAQLLSEMGEFDQATAYAKQLEKQMKGLEAPYVQMVYAKIHLEKGEPDLARKRVEAALSMDPGHVLAKRMEAEITKGN